MSIKYVLATAAVGLSLSAGQAFAGDRGVDGPSANQAAAYPIAASAVGHWIYGRQGNIIGSVRSLAEDGRTAVIMVGSYFDPGSHEARVPSSALVIMNDKVVLRTETTEALNDASQR